MKESHTLINSDFQQPFSASYSRVLQDREEIIDYPPNSHVRIWYNSEPYDYENHYHNCVEILYMLENDCNAKFPTKNISLNAGDIMIIPPYIMHQITSSRQSKQFVILMDVDLLVKFDIYASRDSFNDILLCNKDNCPQIYNIIKNNIIDMINYYFINEDYWQLDIYSLYLNIISTLGKSGVLNKGIQVKTNSASNKEHYDKFAELLQYLELNYSEQITLDSISSHVGFSKYHFIRLFKEYTGSTFYDYLTNKRIHHAKELLKTNMGITEIAFSCGFNNQTSFCRSFKKEVGCTPTDYRQQESKK